ncbi:hypothetical protein [Pseudomonas sp. GM102]|uniref:hypothetical protein n=1 Tax=Pseudomonas sp. GM102 TaxID=1144321 RepID=UPI0012FACBE0|nr:hypothetical protein [Pseudomonas sp. GM102]
MRLTLGLPSPVAELAATAEGYRAGLSPATFESRKDFLLNRSEENNIDDPRPIATHPTGYDRHLTVICLKKALGAGINWPRRDFSRLYSRRSFAGHLTGYLDLTTE